MGIKGVYGEIGPGKPTALIKLAVEKKEQENRNFRIAVDISIWLYQVQLGQGGVNADLRNIFYRSLRLLRLSIEPLFVFDGPHKPPFKRNKKTTTSNGSGLAASAKRLFDAFGFPYIIAPGEAEAECALLQKEGVVDAVLSEDVDTLMFGCTTHLRNWDLKGKASHVDVYKADEIKAGPSGLDREGLVLIALMSGGDYTPAGIPNCGIKTACEAARANFGSSLAQIDRKNTVALREWRARLEHELQTNESKFFRARHKTLQIPDDFPNKAVLYYYTNPVVSTAEQVEKYRRELKWREPNMKAFWETAGEFFDWVGVEGLRHFTRNFAPALVGWRLANGHEAGSFDDLDTQAASEEQLVKSISVRRSHPSADEVPELRIAYIPQDIVGISFEDLRTSGVVEASTHTATYSEDEEETARVDEEDNIMAKKRRVTASYDPAAIEKDWFAETFVKIGVPLLAEKWEADLRDPKKFASRKARARQQEKAAIPKGAIEKYLHVQKPGSDDAHVALARAKSVEATRKQHVSSISQTTSDKILTNSGISSVAVATTSRKTISRSKSSTSEAAATVPTIKAHARVTKPAVIYAVDQRVKNDDLWQSNKLFSDPRTSDVKQDPSIATANCDLQLTARSFEISVDLENLTPERSMCSNMVSEVSFGGGHVPCSKIDAVEVLCKSVENDQFVSSESPERMSKKRRSPLLRTISAPTQSRTRPTTNPWKTIDEFDTSFETPMRKKHDASAIVDLTLS